MRMSAFVLIPVIAQAFKPVYVDIVVLINQID